ncbi:MAG: serine/threonine-protein kinase, partial [Myxococcota bacterium]
MESFLFCHRLGHGGMAEAFLALQRGIGGFEKLVVVKRMHPHLRYDDDLVRLFVNEARLAATIRHPNVVQMLNVRRNERELFIIMEYLSGESLFDMLRAVAEAHRLVPIHIACKIGADLASGLEAGHSVAIGGRPRPVIHRDVTPSNILVGYDGLTRLLDFGIAEGLTAGERNGPQRGKIGYLAPEQLEDGFAD